jgi:hypothetical protein
METFNPIAAKNNLAFFKVPRTQLLSKGGQVKVRWRLELETISIRMRETQCWWNWMPTLMAALNKSLKIVLLECISFILDGDLTRKCPFWIQS